MTHRQIAEGNITIDCFGFKEIVIATHGGYTPKRSFIQLGSGTTKVPSFVKKVCFYSDHDQASIGNAINSLATDVVRQEQDRLQLFRDAGLAAPRDPNYKGQVVVTPNEIKNSGAEIINYSLTNNGKYSHIEGIKLYTTMDILRIREGNKAHLSDVWKLFAKHNLKYDIVHYGACRVNKLSTHVEKIS